MDVGEVDNEVQNCSLKRTETYPLYAVSLCDILYVSHLLAIA